MNTPSEGFILRERVLELRTTILERHPRMPALLQEIWKTLKQYPEQVTLMDEEQINIIVEGLKVQTGVAFAASAVKPSTAAKKNLDNKIKTLGADAF
jgi:hypothetical protein